MKIGVISDTHGSVDAWERAINGPFRDMDLIIHAGDILYHGPRNPFPQGYKGNDLADAINSSKIPILVTKGNCDSAVDQAVLRVPIQTPYLFLQLEGLRIMATHGDDLSDEDMVNLAEQYGVKLLIHGHTHVPRLLIRKGHIILNPGSPSLPKQEDSIPTVAVVEGDTIRIVSLDTNEIIDETLIE